VTASPSLTAVTDMVAVTDTAMLPLCAARYYIDRRAYIY